MKYIANIFLIIISLGYTSISAATAQTPDQILIDDQVYDLHVDLLDPLIESNRIKIIANNDFSTVNWRGYLANWIVKNSVLWLSELKVFQNDGYKNVLPRVFPGKEEIKADWFNGTLFLGHGNPIIYRNMGYASEYENYLMLVVKKGTVMEKKYLTLEQFQKMKGLRFMCYQKTAKYQRRYREALKKMSPDEAVEFIFEFSVDDYLN